MAAVAAALAAAACGDGGTAPRGSSAPDGALALAASGRRERSGVLALSLTRTVHEEGVARVEPVALERVALSAVPAASVAFRGDSAVLRVAGSVRIVARVDGRADTLALTVAKPPVILFDRVVNGNRDVWAVALDGGDLRRLTTHPSDDARPSRAGDRVVFVSYRHGNAELYTLSLAGGEDAGVRRLTATAEAEGDPALAPDGTALAFTREVGGAMKLFVAAADGSNARRAVASLGFAGSIDASPRWTRRGDRLVFGSTASGISQVYAVALASGAAVRLTGTGGPFVEPSWDDTAERVVFVSGDRAASGLHMLAVAGGAATVLTANAADGQPAWLSDGRVVFVTRISGIARLCWLDPTVPGVVHPIDTGPGDAAHPNGP